MVKKLLSIGAAAVMGACLFCGCGDGATETICELQEAYENGFLTKTDLQNIAEEFHKNSWDFSAEDRLIGDFGKNKLNAIKETEAENIRNGNVARFPKREVKSKDLTIVGYYGSFNNCVALRIAGGLAYPDVIETVIIDDVTFNFTGPFIRIWLNSFEKM